ncbi:hypothetical protein ACQ4PT_041980 [Festuca glaucescens]
MAGLRAAHGGPPFEPHATVVGAVTLRRSAAIEALRAAAVAAVAPYTARVTGVARGDFFYQCVYLLLEPTPEIRLRRMKMSEENQASSASSAETISEFEATEYMTGKLLLKLEITKFIMANHSVSAS